MNLNDLQTSVTGWANARNLVRGTTSEKQFIKLIEEAGELGECISKNKMENFKLELGDMLVVLNILAAQNDTNLNECFLLAWHKIKDRKGQMKNGFFIKEEDL